METIIHNLNTKYSKPEANMYAQFKHAPLPASFEKIKKELETNKFKDPNLIIFTSNYSMVDPHTNRTEFLKGKVIHISELDSFGIKDAYISALNDLIHQKIEVRKQNRINNTAANLFTDTLGEAQLATKSISLAIPTVDSKYTDADKSYFQWWARDVRNNFYMKLKSGQYIPVPLLEGQVRKIAPDPSFWTAFWKEHRDDINAYDTIINNIAWEHYEHNDNGDINMLKEIHLKVPKLILEGTVLTAVIETTKHFDESSKKDVSVKHVRNIEWMCGSSSMPKTSSEYNLQQALAPVMLQLDISEIPLMKRMSNEYGAAMFYYKLPELSNKANCPKTWKDFLNEALTVNPMSQKYRLAKFITSVIDANNYSPQALCIAGHGGDGKSVMMNAICSGFNKINQYVEFAKNINEEGIHDNNTQNGLVNALESRMIYMPDVKKNKEILESTFFKQITGCDKITCTKKYRDPIEKDMSGVKFVWTTNYNVYLSGEYAIRRVIPVFFTPKPEGYKKANPVELTKSLAADFDEFVAWCYNFANAIDKKFGIDSGECPIIDIDAMLAGKESMTTKACWESLMTDTQKFFFKAADEYEEDDNSVFREFVTAMFSIPDANEDLFNPPTAKDTVPISDIFSAWAAYVKDGKHEYLNKSYSVGPKTRDARALFQWLKQQGCEKVKVNGKYWAVNNIKAK